MNPHDVTAEFEQAVADYCGSPLAVAVTSCTIAIQLACMWFYRRGHRGALSMPTRSYVGIPASIKNAGFAVGFREEGWQGEYKIDPLPLWDSARRFTSGMFRRGQMQCVSGHWTKILSTSQLGVILLDDAQAYDWLKRARFDGRRAGVDPKDDDIIYPSVHAYLSPEVAAHGLVKLSTLPKHNADLPRSDYPRLDLMEAFK